MIKSEVSSIKSWAASKLNWVEENWTEIWFHSVIENNYVETTLATTFLSIPKLFLSNLLKFPRVPEDFKLDAESNKHRLLQQRTTAAALFYHSCSQLSMDNFHSTKQYSHPRFGKVIWFPTLEGEGFDRRSVLKSIGRCVLNS